MCVYCVTLRQIASVIQAESVDFILFEKERGGLDSFTHDALKMKYKLDNEFELVFVVSVTFM